MTTERTPVRILLADDHGILRGGVKALLNADSNLRVVGEAADGQEAIRLAVELQPDLIILDLSMPGTGGLEATRRLKEILPNVFILILTVHEEESLLREVIRAGAAGYIIKRAVEGELLNAIQVVLRGDLYIHPAMARALLKDISPYPVAHQVGLESLTVREVEILRLIARGLTNKQIAARLCLSPRTVEGHRANLMSKLGLHSRVDLVSYAEDHGLIP